MCPFFPPLSPHKVYEVFLFLWRWRPVGEKPVTTPYGTAAIYDDRVQFRSFGRGIFRRGEKCYENNSEKLSWGGKNILIGIAGDTLHISKTTPESDITNRALIDLSTYPIIFWSEEQKMAGKNPLVNRETDQGFSLRSARLFCQQQTFDRDRWIERSSRQKTQIVFMI